MLKVNKLLIFFLSLFLLFSFSASAQDLWGQQADMMVGSDKIGGAFGEMDEPRDIKDSVIDILRIVLGFLALILTLIIMWAGYTWMTSSGNQDKISLAKKWMIRAFAGLIIILCALLIVSFVSNTTNKVL